MAYLESVAGAAPATPFLYYHFPGITGLPSFEHHLCPCWPRTGPWLAVGSREVTAAAMGRIPTFAGVKHTSVDLADGAEAARLGGGAFDVLVGAECVGELARLPKGSERMGWGWGQMLLGALAMGLEGSIGISYSILPKTCGRIREAWQAGKVAEAREAQVPIPAIAHLEGMLPSWQGFLQDVWSAVLPSRGAPELIRTFKAALGLLHPALEMGPPR